MTDDPNTSGSAPVTLGQALEEFLKSVKAEQRVTVERYVRKYVQDIGEHQEAAWLTGSRVESYAEANIRASDPLAGDRVAALKTWFVFLKKKNYTEQNFGAMVRVRRIAGRSATSSAAQRIQEAPIDMTAEGIEALKAELTDLGAKREEIVEAITIAREDKDFRENAPLDAAREALAFNEQRAKQIEEALKRARVVQTTDESAAAVGSSVTVTKLDDGIQTTFRLVGPREANAAEKKISIESPVGKELIGRRAGDEVVVTAPNRQIHYRVDHVARS